MPANFFEELIGKTCDITLRDDEDAVGTLLAAEGDWLKLDDGFGSTVYVNANQIISLSVEEKRDDRESRWNKRRR